jgi:hypothetical protein
MTDKFRDIAEMSEDQLIDEFKARDTLIESLRQKLEDSVHAYDVCQQECERMKQQLAESQARERVLRDFCSVIATEQVPWSFGDLRDLLAQPFDSIALDEAIKQALLDAADELVCDAEIRTELRRMAEELPKGEEQ